MSNNGSEKPLPKLRSDLSLLPGARSSSGEPRWLIYDPVRHRYFEISETAFELLSVWSDNPRHSLKRKVNENFNRSDCEIESAIDDLIHFITANSLTDEPPGGDSRAYLEQSRNASRSLFMTSLHGYLFIRFPILRPSRFLAATLPIVAPLFSRTAFFITLACGLAGLYLVSRQWDTFLHTFLHFFSIEGALLYGLSLVLIKTLHELAHAYTATRYGVRVPTMGVALMVMFPVLYTDVTDAWRLRCKKQQLAIAGAGIVMELAIACFATLAWALLPDGPFRSIAFTLAASSWILSLAVNLNPLMRFDGYYLLADLWGISNLQTRSFAIGRWWLRETLFGLGHPPPDRFNSKTRNLLVFYALSTWVYRLILFIGIALIVYHFFFKALGVLLFITEIVFFIALPILREISAWWVFRKDIMSSRRTALTAAVLTVLIALSVIPWSSSVVVPAILESSREVAIFPPAPAKLTALHVMDGDFVAKGQILARLGSPNLEHRLHQTQQKINLAKLRLARTASGDEERSNTAIILRELHALNEELEGHNRELERLTLRAPLAGQVRDLHKLLHPGRWLNNRELIARIVDTSDSQLRGTLAEDDLWRIDVGSSGTFIPDDPMRDAHQVVLTDWAVTGESELSIAYLASIFGGQVAVEKDSSGNLKPRGGIHTVRFSSNASTQSHPTMISKVVRGVIHLNGRPESFAATAWRQIMRVVVRETNF